MVYQILCFSLKDHWGHVAEPCKGPYSQAREHLTAFCADQRVKDR